MNEDNEQHQQEEPSSRHLLVALEDLLKRSDHSPIFLSKITYQSKSLDDLLIHQRHRKENDQQISTDDINNISNTTRTELNLSGIGYDDEEDDDDYNIQTQRSQSAPVSPTKFYDKELAAFIQSDQQQQQQEELIGNSFVYNIDLSYSNENSHQFNSKLAIFFDDDLLSEEIDYEPSVSLIHSSLINNCLTITEENEEELEQLRRDDDEEQQQRLFSIPINILEDDTNHQTDKFENDNQNLNETELEDMTNEDNIERLSTIYESPSPQSEIEEDIDDDIYDKLIIYDLANVDTSTKVSMIHPMPKSSTSTSSSYRSPIIDSSHTNASGELCNTLSTSRLFGRTTMITCKNSNPSFLSTSPLITNNDEKSSSSPVINAQIIPSSLSSKDQLPCRSSPMLLSTPTNEQSHHKLLPSHITKMKVIQSSSSSLSDFISATPISTLPNNTSYYEEVPNVPYSLTDCSLIPQTSSLTNENDLIPDKTMNKRKFLFPRHILTNGLLLSHCVSNPIPRRTQENLKVRTLTKQKSEAKLPTNSSLSSESRSSSDEKILSRSDYILQQEQNISQQHKASSLRTISMISPQLSSKILYPIGFETNNMDESRHQNRSSHSHQVATSDSDIVSDTRPTSKSSIEEDDNIDQLKQYEINYRKTLTDLSIIKKNLVNNEGRLNETMRELEIEHALIEGEHELAFKQVLDASTSDQQKIRQLYRNLQLTIERIMTEKNLIRNEIDYIQQTLFKLEHELHELEQEYRSSDEKILKKKELIAITRKKYEDLEFQLMELETRCESELEQAEEHFQNEQKLVTQNAQIRQNTLRELDCQQYMVLHQITTEKEKLEREKEKLRLLFKQKKLEANLLQQKLHGKNTPTHINGANGPVYQSSSTNLYTSLAYPNGISSPKMEKKDDHEKITNLEQQIKRIELEQQLSTEIQNHDYQVKLRDKTRIQERPLTRYLPIRSANFNLRAHIEGAGHALNSLSLILTSTSCRGYLHKMGGIKFKTWNRRWFVFDRQLRSLFYYQDKSETKLRGCIYFQSILEVYIDHLQSISLRSPEPREATFIVKTIQRPYYLVAPTVELMRIWIDVIITGAEGNTFAGV